MFKKSIIIIQIISLLLTASCRVSRVPVPAGNRLVLSEQYINNYKGLAISEMKRTGVPASITLAQGMIESDFGRSSLATKANNHFGIKCHTDWSGPTFYTDDDKRNECFRKYSHSDESFRDHSDFLVSGSRYSSLFDIDPTDYKSWARGLKKAGYATDPDYADMLIRVIEEFSLYNYDSPSDRVDNNDNLTNIRNDNSTVITKSDSVSAQQINNLKVPVGASRILVRNRINYIIVKEGDTFESLINEFQLLRFEIQKYNELPVDYTIVPGQILYLQPKRNKAEVGNDYYTVKESETMYDVSQIFGIKLKFLLEMNRMEAGAEPVAGQKLWLRSTKPPE
jgi:hypothetical protein